MQHVVFSSLMAKFATHYEFDRVNIGEFVKCVLCMKNNKSLTLLRPLFDGLFKRWEPIDEGERRSIIHEDMLLCVYSSLLDAAILLRDVSFVENILRNKYDGDILTRVDEHCNYTKYSPIVRALYSGSVPILSAIKKYIDDHRCAQKVSLMGDDYYNILTVLEFEHGKMY